MFGRSVGDRPEWRSASLADLPVDPGKGWIVVVEGQKMKARWARKYGAA
jgi:hypothetical protein